MRVTHKLFNDRFIKNLNRTLTKTDKVMRQLATGKEHNLPSDAPSDFSIILKQRVTISNQMRYTENIASAKPRLNGAENQLSDLFELLSDTKDLAIRGANGTESSESRRIMAREIKGIMGRVFAISNSSENGLHLFGGRETLTSPFVLNNGQYEYRGDGGDIRQVFSDRISIAVNITGSTAFQGNMAVSSVKVQPSLTTPAGGGDVSFTMGDGINTSGTVTLSAGVSYTQTQVLSLVDGALGSVSISASFNASGYLTLTSNVSDNVAEVTLTDLSTSANTLSDIGLKAGTKRGIDIFRMFTDLETAMISENTGDISKILSQVNTAIEQVVGSMGEIGSRGVQLNFLEIRLENEQQSSVELLSSLEDADFADAVRRVKELEITYQASLAAASRFMNISLLNFLR